MMLELHSSYDPTTGEQWVWDATSIKAAEKCPRYYQYTIQDCWTGIGGRVHLWFGQHYAKAHERMHIYEAKGMSREDALREVVRLLLVETWEHELDHRDERISGTGSPVRYPHPAKTRENLVRSIVWYYAEFDPDPLRTLILSDGTAAAEHSFKLTVDDGMVFAGHLDRPTVDDQDNVFIQDQKTTGQTLGPYYWKQFKPDSQFSMYTFAGEAIFNIPVNGVIIDAAQVAVGFTRFGRMPTFRTKSELNEWYDETMELIHRIRGYTRNGWFPRNPASCNNFGGCAFRDICARTPDVRDNFLKGDFEKRERWEPIQPR